MIGWLFLKFDIWQIWKSLKKAKKTFFSSFFVCTNHIPLHYNIIQKLPIYTYLFLTMTLKYSLFGSEVLPSRWRASYQGIIPYIKISYFISRYQGIIPHIKISYLMYPTHALVMEEQIKAVCLLACNQWLCAGLCRKLVTSVQL